MKKTIISILLSVFTFSVSYADGDKGTGKVYEYNELIILQADSLIVGAYFTFEQFVTNSPVFTDLPMTEKRGTFVDKDYYLVNGNRLWKIDANKKETLVNPSGKNLWGWCDGKRLYINKYTSTFHQEFVLLGRYSVFTMKSTGGYMGTTEARTEYILDVTTGETFMLSAKTLEKKILPQLPNLLAQFKEDATRSYKYNWYLEEFNKMYAEKHKK